MVHVMIIRGRGDAQQCKKSYHVCLRLGGRNP